MNAETERKGNDVSSFFLPRIGCKHEAGKVLGLCSQCKRDNVYYCGACGKGSCSTCGARFEITPPHAVAVATAPQ
jgi:hypothetical protein